MEEIFLKSEPEYEEKLSKLAMDEQVKLNLDRYNSNRLYFCL